MTLQTTADLPFTSPLAHTLREQTALSPAQAYDTVGLADLSGQMLWHVRGANVEAALSDVPPSVGDVTMSDDGLLARLRGDTALVIGAGAADLSSTIDENSLLTVTDITHGRGHLLLIGKRAPDVLPKVCGLDFDSRAFPNDHVAQSSLAKTRTTIIRHDRESVPAYHLIVGTSLAAYVWDIVFDAMSEFGGLYVGEDDT